MPEIPDIRSRDGLPAQITTQSDPSTLTTQSILREISSLKELVWARLDAMSKAQDQFQESVVRVPTDVDKQVSRLKDLVDEKLATVNEKFHAAEISRGRNEQVSETRLGALQEAAGSSLRIYEERHKEIPALIQAAVDHLQELHQEKFDSVANQFKERDTRSERESRDNKVAVDAAFAAQKEAASEQNKSNTLAIDKSEKATAETLNKQADLFKSTTDALAASISASVSNFNGQIGDIKVRLATAEAQSLAAKEASAAASAVAAANATLLTTAQRDVNQGHQTDRGYATSTIISLVSLAFVIILAAKDLFKP